MPQMGQRVVAPTNPAPQWPAGYIAVLREAGAQGKTIPYCIAWVRRFFARHPGRRRRELGRPEIEAFLHELVARGGVDNWQVQQARNALELYYERFRGIALAARPDGMESPPSGLPPTVPRFPPVAEHRSSVHTDPKLAEGIYTVRPAGDKPIVSPMVKASAVSGGVAPSASRVAYAQTATGPKPAQPFGVNAHPGATVYSGVTSRHSTIQLGIP